jgi:hypothetical protein
MPDFPPLVIALEGEYSDWTIYDSFDDTDASFGTARQGAITNRVETQMLLCDYYSNIVKKYTISTKVLSAALVNDALIMHDSGGYFTPPQLYSAYGTYVVSLGGPSAWPSKVYVFKNGALIKTFTAADLGIISVPNGLIASVSISPKGKYIAVSGVREATGNMGWVILEGS